MNNYETLMIINPTLTEEEKQNNVQKIEELINSNGEVTNTEIWGEKKLAYPIQEHNEGYYVLLEFKSNPEFISELNRIYEITDDIMKHIIVKKENEE